MYFIPSVQKYMVLDMASTAAAAAAAASDLETSFFKQLLAFFWTSQPSLVVTLMHFCFRLLCVLVCYYLAFELIKIIFILLFCFVTAVYFCLPILLFIKLFVNLVQYITS